MRRRIPVIALFTLLSVMLHAAIMGPVAYLFDNLEIEGFETQWDEEFVRLSGVGDAVAPPGPTDNAEELAAVVLPAAPSPAPLEEVPAGEEPTPESLEDLEDLEEADALEELPKPEVPEDERPPEDARPEPAPEPETAPKPQPEAPANPQPEVATIPETPPAPEPEKIRPTRRPRPLPAELLKRRPSRDAQGAKTAEDEQEPFVALTALDRSGPSNVADMRHYAPGNARMTALVRVDRLRDSPYAEPVRRILQSVPDYRILLDATELDPMQEIEHIFMASANPRYVDETFLAIRHKMKPETIREVLAARHSEPIPWQRGEHFDVRPLVPASSRYQDPRQLLLTGEGLVMVARPEWVEQLVAPIAKDSPRAGDLYAGAKPAFLQGLYNIEQAAKAEDDLVVLSAQGLVYQIPGLGRLPRFESVRLALRRPEAPTLHLDLQFASVEEAERFAQSCPALAQQLIKGIPFARALGIAPLVERLGCTHEGRYTTVRGTYTERELLSLLQLALPFIPRPPALNALPPMPVRPEPAPEAGPDAGATAPGRSVAPPVGAGSGGADFQDLATP